MRCNQDGRDCLETIARQMKGNAITAAASLGPHLFSQGHDKWCPQTCLQRGAVHSDRGLAASVGGQHPMIDRNASDMSLGSVAIDGWCRNLAESEAVQDPCRYPRAESLLN